LANEGDTVDSINAMVPCYAHHRFVATYLSILLRNNCRYFGNLLKTRLLSKLQHQGCQVGPFGPNLRILVPNNTCWPQSFRLALWLFFGHFPG